MSSCVAMIEKSKPLKSAFRVVFPNHFSAEAGNLSDQLYWFVVCPCTTFRCTSLQKEGGAFSLHLPNLSLPLIGWGDDGHKMITSSIDTTSQTVIPFFRKQVSLSDPHFHCYLQADACPKSLALSTCHTASELGTQIKICGLPIVYSPIVTFQTL